MDFQKENCLVRVSFTGGIIGLLAGSYLGRLQKAISTKNVEGWNLAEVIPDNRNLIIWVFRFLLLILTLGFWTLSTGYILIFERPFVGDVRAAKSAGATSGRQEPSISAPRKQH
jgi:hypothetical protein